MQQAQGESSWRIDRGQYQNAALCLFSGRRHVGLRNRRRNSGDQTVSIIYFDHKESLGAEPGSNSARQILS